MVSLAIVWTLGAHHCVDAPIWYYALYARDDNVDNDMFDPDEAMTAAVDKRKFLLKRLLEDQGHFPGQ